MSFLAFCEFIVRFVAALSWAEHQHHGIMASWLVLLLWSPGRFCVSLTGPKNQVSSILKARFFRDKSRMDQSGTWLFDRRLSRKCSVVGDIGCGRTKSMSEDFAVGWQAEEPEKNSWALGRRY